MNEEKGQLPSKTRNPLAGLFPPHLSPNSPLLSLLPHRMLPPPHPPNFSYLLSSLVLKLKAGAPCFRKLSFQKSPLLKKTVLFFLPENRQSALFSMWPTSVASDPTDFIFYVPPSLIVGYCPGSMKLLKE